MKTTQALNRNFNFSGNDERTNRLIDSIRSGILLQSSTAEILYCNQAALSILGISRDELNGRFSFMPDCDVIHEDGTPFPEETHPFQIVFQTKKSVTNVVMGFFRPGTDNRIWLLVDAEPLIDDKGQVKEVICSFSDITDRKQAEEKMTWLYQSLEVRALELATMYSELERFVSVATHDLQEPLRLVTSFTQLLKKKYEDQLDEQAIEYINYAVEGAGRMKKLLLDLLEYSKFISNKDELEFVEIDKVVNVVLKNLSTEIGIEKAVINIEHFPKIYANESMLIQLFENLIGNALKFRNNCKPEINIAFTESDTHYQFSVKDNGIGIAPEYSNKIFKLFQRLHSDNLIYKGNGVGLAICRKIVEFHNGTIWVKAEQGKGSTFSFTIAKNKTTEHE